jgi:hypothetical protein
MLVLNQYCYETPLKTLFNSIDPNQTLATYFCGDAKRFFRRLLW